MSDESGPMCACKAVMHDPIQNDDGSWRDRWRCLDCDSEFVREIPTAVGLEAVTSGAVAAALKSLERAEAAEAEVDRLRTAVRDIDFSGTMALTIIRRAERRAEAAEERVERLRRVVREALAELGPGAHLDGVEALEPGDLG